MIYRGGCHCGAVRFEVEAPERILVQDCNCSLCAMTGFLHLIVPKSKFRLVKGEENITTYTFNTGIAKHTFCRTCGIKSFYVPRSYPEGYSVNARCLDEGTVEEMTVVHTDGKNWEKTHASGHGKPVAMK